MNIYEKLSNIQNELKAPKGQINSFGNYNYRSCEDILEAVKPLCRENKCVLVITDEIIREDSRFYIKAITTLIDLEGETNISNSAFARESLDKKGMDESQITGACSSYARKYALNGLFCIDDTKDADTDAYKKQEDKAKNYNDKKQDIESAEDRKLKKEIEETKAKLVTAEKMKGFLESVKSSGISEELLTNILYEFNFNSTADIKTIEELTTVWQKICKIKKEGK